MGLILKHVERTKSGSFQYRRRVPKEVSPLITKREFKHKLGDTNREALAAYARYHARVEQEIAEAKLRLARSEAANLPGASERDAYAEALRRRADMISMGMDAGALSLTADSIADSYPQDEYEPVGVPPVERHTINLLRLGPDRYKAPEPTLGDALAFYLKERRGDDSPRSLKRLQDAAKRVVGHVQAALKHDPVLTSLTRDDAREVRDYMLDRVMSTGERISPASVSRDMNGLNAIINFATLEMPLPASFRNPFSSLKVAAVAGADRGGGADELDGEKREPLPPAVLIDTRKRVLQNANEELALIWRMLEATGCRLAEVVGLRVVDVDVTGELPRIRVRWHEERRVKNRTSMRSVPLVADALESAKEALKLTREGHMLFPTYGREGGPGAASAALMKHVRAVTKDSKHVVHSLRHNMKDWLILADVSQLNQNLILGQGSCPEGHQRGLPAARVHHLLGLRQAAHGVLVAGQEPEVPLLSLPNQGLPELSQVDQAGRAGSAV